MQTDEILNYLRVKDSCIAARIIYVWKFMVNSLNVLLFFKLGQKNAFLLEHPNTDWMNWNIELKSLKWKEKWGKLYSKQIILVFFQTNHDSINRSFIESLLFFQIKDNSVHKQWSKNKLIVKIFPSVNTYIYNVYF